MQKRENIEKYLDKSLPLAQRKIEFKKHMDKVMNPIPVENFDPKDFEPMETPDLEKEIYFRERKKHAGKLPVPFGLEPKVIREGQMIGMFESKQDIYLLFAHKINELIDEIAELKAELANRKNK